MLDIGVNQLNREPFIFIVGCPRSGTTLLRGMLDSHPDLAIPWESHFIPELARNLHQYGEGRSFDAESFRRDLLSTAFRHWSIDSMRLERTLIHQRPSSYADAVRCVFQVYAEARGKKRYGDKTPAYVNEIELLSQLFPESRFIHLIRDGRNVAQSLQETSWGPCDLGAAAKLWKSSVQRGRSAGHTLGLDRYREIRYEQLVARPEIELRGLCAFAEISWDRAMLRSHERAAEIISSDPFPEYHQNIFHPVGAVSRDWRTQMSTIEVKLIESICGDLLEEFGYPRATG